MDRPTLLCIFLAAATVGCSAAPRPVAPAEIEGAASHPPRRGVSPAIAGRGLGAADSLPWSERLSYPAEGPSTIDLAEVPVVLSSPVSELDGGKAGSRIDSPLPDVVLDYLRMLAALQPAAAGVQSIGRTGPTGQGPAVGVSFDSLDITDCCSGGTNTPPDNEVAVGPDHIMAVVNVAFEIYDKSGNALPAGTGGPIGPRTFSSFFGSGSVEPPLACGEPFDPNVVYDEAADRFIIGVDSGFTGYCVAVSKTGDPTGQWWAYRFPTNIGGASFDFPHAGVGHDAIFVGSNQFVGSFLEGRVFAWDKATMYAGGSPLVIKSHSTGGDSTPQPANLHGWAQGTWPTGGPHYVLTETFDGSNHSVWSWDFATDIFVKLEPDLDLAAAAGVPCPGGTCIPIDAPQMGSAAKLQANDYRGLDAEYRNGSIWTTQSVSCNPGAGVVDCVRWAEIDPTIPTVLQAGVFGGVGEHRLFPDAAANHCGDMAVGYSKTSTVSYPGAFVTGRQVGDSLGTLQPAEATLQAGEVVYASASYDSPPHRWGDYSGMTVDPDGFTFWYLGEYSKNIGTLPRWGTAVGSFSYPCAVVDVAPNEVGFDSIERGTQSPAAEVTVSNVGSGENTFTAMVLSDTSNFALDVGGGLDPCNSSVVTIGPADSCTVAVTFQPQDSGPFEAALSFESPNPANTRLLPLRGSAWVECTAPDTVDLEVPDPVMSYTACIDILAGPWTIDEAITLIAGESIQLRNGLVVQAGLDVTWVTDPFLGPP